MLATSLLVFREVLEAALIISIVMVATRGVVGRMRLVAMGIAVGITGAIVVAIFAGQLAQLAGGFGQELFNATVLLAAAAMIGWHVIWMARHGRALQAQTEALGASVRAGERPLAAIAVLVALAVAREGSEIVLFLYGMSAGGMAAGALISGSVVGLVGGVLIGIVLYLGLLRIRMARLFGVTNMLLMLLAAGLASQAARFLIQADVLPALNPRLWDSSWLLSEQSLLGQILHVLVGYSASPAGMQVIFYLTTVVVFFIGARLCAPRARARTNPA